MEYLNKLLEGKTFIHNDGETCTVGFIAEYNSEHFPQDRDVMIMYTHPKKGQQAENFVDFLLRGTKIEE